MSPGRTEDVTSVYLTRNKSASEDYEQLCRLDVLGISDYPGGDQNLVYEEFKKQLIQCNDRRYETGLLWKPGHPPLPFNKQGSLARLSSLLRKLKANPPLLKAYDDVIRELIADGVVERVPDEESPSRNECYQRTCGVYKTKNRERWVGKSNRK